jgi:hypothetical protein
VYGKFRDCFINITLSLSNESACLWIPKGVSVQYDFWIFQSGGADCVGAGGGVKVLAKAMSPNTERLLRIMAWWGG